MSVAQTLAWAAGSIVLGCLVIWIAARLIFAAYFKSRAEYINRLRRRS